MDCRLGILTKAYAKEIASMVGTLIEVDCVGDGV